jgi:hypothetical protein
MNRLVYVVDSHNRLVESDSHSNFTFKITLPSYIAANSSGLAVACLRACIPRSYYVVNSTYGNTFTLIEGAATAVVTIPVGNYSVSSFASVLKTALQTASPNARTYTITYSAITGKYSYSCSGAASFQLAAITGSGLHEQLGVTPSRTATTTFVLPFTAANVVNFRLKDTLQVHSDICTAGKNDTLQDIVIAGLPNFSSVAYNSTDTLMNAKALNTVASNVYYLRITDEDGKIIDLNGVNCVVTLVIFQPMEILQKKFMLHALSKDQKEE